MVVYLGENLMKKKNYEINGSTTTVEITFYDRCWNIALFNLIIR
jgi:hypothetical protein